MECECFTKKDTRKLVKMVFILVFIKATSAEGRPPPTHSGADAIATALSTNSAVFKNKELR